MVLLVDKHNIQWIINQYIKLKLAISRDRDGLRVIQNDTICIGSVIDNIDYVRHGIQIVTITLPIHYCISSITYAIKIYNVNNKQRKATEYWKSLEISTNSYKYLQIVLIISDRICDSVGILYTYQQELLMYLRYNSLFQQ